MVIFVCDFVFFFFFFVSSLIAQKKNSSIWRSRLSFSNSFCDDELLFGFFAFLISLLFCCHCHYVFVVVAIELVDPVKEEQLRQQVRLVTRLCEQVFSLDDVTSFNRTERDGCYCERCCNCGSGNGCCCCCCLYCVRELLAIFTQLIQLHRRDTRVVGVCS